MKLIHCFSFWKVISEFIFSLLIAFGVRKGPKNIVDVVSTGIICGFSGAAGYLCGDVKWVTWAGVNGILGFKDSDLFSN